MAKTKGVPAVTERRAKIIGSAKFKKAHAAALAKRESTKCKNGHDLANPANVHTGDLYREGVVTCRTCVEAKMARYLARKAS